MSVMTIGKGSRGVIKKSKMLGLFVNYKKKGALVAAIIFTVSAQASFDQLGVSAFSDDAPFADVEFPGVQFVSLPALKLESESSVYLLSGQNIGVKGVNASAVPVPSALWFFGSALVALMVIQRRV